MICMKELKPEYVVNPFPAKRNSLLIPFSVILMFFFFHSLAIYIFLLFVYSLLIDANIDQKVQKIFKCFEQ